jgi:hypothetical protein
MKLGTIFHPTRDTETLLASPAHEEHKRQVREKRLETARGQPNWTGIPKTRLVRRGQVFEPDRAFVGYVADNTPMTYTVDATGDVVFLEPATGLAPGANSSPSERDDAERQHESRRLVCADLQLADPQRAEARPICDGSVDFLSPIGA